MKLTFKQLHDDAYIPEKAHASDAGLDLRSPYPFSIPPTRTVFIRTGLAIEPFPPSSDQLPALLVLPRSGLATKYGITVMNSPGLIDAGYRGEIGVVLINHGHSIYHGLAGQRVAQLLPILLPQVNIEVAEELSATERGAGGFGSTGR